MVFARLARDPPADDPPFEGELVYADREKCLCRHWNWRQDARRRIRPETRDAVCGCEKVPDTFLCTAVRLKCRPLGP